MSGRDRGSDGGHTARRARPLDLAGLDRLALAYVGRFSTTRVRLTRYLSRKVAERGWSESAEAPVDAVVDRLTAAGYLDDRVFAETRGRELTRRGHGDRRLRAVLQAAGVAERDAAPALETAQGAAWTSALAFARRRRLGPFANSRAVGDEARRALAAMMRAGHDYAIARAIIVADPGVSPENPTRDLER